MGFAVRDIELTATSAQQESRFRIESGVLRAVSLRQPAGETGLNDGFAQIWLCFDDSPENADGVLLADGHIGASLAIGWTGRLPLPKAASLRTVIWLEQATTLRVSALTSPDPLNTQRPPNA